MAANSDLALLWAFDRLIDCDPDRLPDEVLHGTLLPLVAASTEALPDVVQARLLLRLLESDLGEGRIDDTTLEYLVRLAACQLEGYMDTSFLGPLPGIILAVRMNCGGSRPGLGAWGAAVMVVVCVCSAGRQFPSHGPRWAACGAVLLDQL